MAEGRIRVPKETLSQFAERYKILSNPRVVQVIMRAITENADMELAERMWTLSSHPRDTGLLEKSWKVPEEYLTNHKGKIWEVYLDNTATVSKQYYLKHGKILYTSGRRRHKRGNPKILRNIKYMKFVDKRTKFYTKQLKVVRQKMQPIMREVIRDALFKLNRQYPQLFTPEQAKAIRENNI